ncbi:COR domain-containing protein, partial [Streptosporangium sp. NPDC001559]|uniref:COR domain-containing protein n=1 Tax=Streptosporangium sp. NPDC001559 TaxID=3366187 RepID=UPI0036E6EC83
LTDLNISNNQLAALPEGMAALTGLTDLNISNNQLAALPEGMAALTGLTDLNISNNKLRVIPDWLVDLVMLRNLSTHGNLSISPPPEITSSGTESVLAFLRARREGASEQWVSKLLIVGEGGVGKTSLIKALTGKPHNPSEPTTHGLQISHLPIKHPDRAEVNMDLSAWDFGGQQIYHATHQFFITDRSLFLLLWNARLGWEQGKLRYWLDIITARAPGSPIILIATHADHNERPVDLPLDELRQEYPRIADSISIDSETCCGIDNLISSIRERATNLPLMGTEWPTTWLKSADAIRILPEKHITPGRMWEIMSRTGVSDPVQQRYIAIAMHQLGDILYYHDDEELAQTVVLQPEWVNEYISKVLDSSEVANRHGLLTRNHLNELWWDLDRGLRDHFLGMMDKYDLSYQIDDGRKADISLVVERLPWNPPSYHELWEEMNRLPTTKEIKVIYRLNTMPPGIPTWFIARSHRFTTSRHWRTGALLQHTDNIHRALLRADRHRNVIELAVRGPAPAAFFSVLDDGLNRTLERFPGLDIIRQVPCPCRGTSACPELFDYEDLQSRLLRNPPRHEIECRKSGEFLGVPMLVLGLAPSERDVTRIGLDRLTKIITQSTEKQDNQTEYIQRMFLKLQRIVQAQQEVRCPSVFSLTPIPRNRLAGSAFELRLYCEEPGAWHPLPESRGCYQIKELPEWFRRMSPYLKYLVTVLKHTAPFLGPVLGMTVDQLEQQTKAEADAMKELVSQIPEPTISGEKNEPLGDINAIAESRATLEADFRALESLLIELDPARAWGGLSRTTTPEGLTLYLCAQHSYAYRSSLGS